MSGDAADAVYGGTSCHSLGSRTRAVAMTSSAPGRHHHHRQMLPELAAAAGVAGSDGQSV